MTDQENHNNGLPGNGVVHEKDSPLDMKRPSTTARDAETPEKKLKYPKVVFFIIGNEFCERFTYYGMRTILSLFLRNALKMQESDATITYHVFTMLCYFFPVLGAIIADSWLGKFKTIAILSVVYAIGNIVVSFSSITTIGIPSLELTYLGLLLIAVGTGGIKPCVSSFGGEQFTVPQQARQLAAFFSVFYFSINAGSLISTWLTPELRTIKCLDMDTCYPLAFGIPAILMIVAIVIFVVGKPGYKITQPKGNVLVDVSKCMGNAIKNKVTSKEKKDNWLDYADASYSQTLRDDIRAMLRVLLLFVPMPVFWALYDQQGSRWTFQANNMNGRIGTWVFKPDQMQVVNPILIMILLPLFESVIYPLLGKIHLLRKPLQRIAVGGMLGSLAFIISALVQLQLDPKLPVLAAPGIAQVRVFNSLPCELTLSATAGDQHFMGTLKPDSFWEQLDISATGNSSLSLSVDGGSCGKASFDFGFEENMATSYHLFAEDAATIKFGGPYKDDFFKDAVAKTRVIYNFQRAHTVYIKSANYEYKYNLNGVGTEGIIDVDPDDFTVSVDNQKIDKHFFDVGGFYYVTLSESNSTVDGFISVVIPENVLNIFWQLPQYIVISVAEVMVSVTGLEFSFTQAPNSMKSVLSSAWLLTDAFGNLIIILIESVKIFPSQSAEIFLFAGLMAVIMLVFIWLAVRYKPVPPPASDSDDLQLTTTSSTTTLRQDSGDTDPSKKKY